MTEVDCGPEWGGARAEAAQPHSARASLAPPVDPPSRPAEEEGREAGGDDVTDEFDDDFDTIKGMARLFCEVGSSRRGGGKFKSGTGKLLGTVRGVPGLRGELDASLASPTLTQTPHSSPLPPTLHLP